MKPCKALQSPAKPCKALQSPAKPCKALQSPAKPCKALLLLMFLMAFWVLGFVSHKYRIPPTNQIVSLYKYIMSIMGVERKNPNYPHIHDRVTLFNTFKQKGDIAFLGDSITEGANWDQIFNNQKVANFGIGGNTIVGMVDMSDIVVDSGAKKNIHNGRC